MSNILVVSLYLRGTRSTILCKKAITFCELVNVDPSEFEICEVFHVVGDVFNPSLGAHNEVDVPARVGPRRAFHGAEGPSRNHPGLLRGLNEKNRPVANDLRGKL